MKGISEAAISAYFGTITGEGDDAPIDLPCPFRALDNLIVVKYCGSPAAADKFLDIYKRIIIVCGYT